MMRRSDKGSQKMRGTNIDSPKLDSLGTMATVNYIKISKVLDEKVGGKYARGIERRRQEANETRI